VKGLEFEHPELEPRIDAYLAERDWSWRMLLDGRCRIGDQALSLDDLKDYLISSDRVLWSECYLLDREEGGEQPWRFWDYQKAAARSFVDAIFKCGAEVGKTLDIVSLTLWLFFGNGPRPRGDILVACPLDGNLDDIYDGVMYQLEENQHLRSRVVWERCKVKPYRKLQSSIGNRVYFRPAGHDGRALRGVHAGLAALFDEAAIVHSKKTWKEFWRAPKPWAVVRLYSVPDGLRDTEFYRLASSAQPVDPLQPIPIERLPGVAVREAADGSEELAARSRRFVLIRWPKTLMPPPFWTEERKLEYVERYGGIDSSEYQQNVLGEDGDPANAIFPWERLAPCLRYLPDYREVQLLYDKKAGKCHVLAYRLSPNFAVDSGEAIDDEEEDSNGERIAQPRVAELVDEIDLANLDLARLVKRFLAPQPGHYVGGADYGSTGDDPTEILLFRKVGPLLSCVLRVQLRRFVNPDQVTVFRAIDEAFRPSHGWGLESTGSGTGLEHDLVHGQRDERGTWSLAGRLTGYIANANLVDRNPETGEPILDERRERETPRMVTTKEYGMRLLEDDVAEVRIHLPYTPDLLAQFSSYRARKTPAGRSFTTTNDHLVDAARVARLRAFDMEYGQASLAPPIFFVPSGMSRPSLEID